MIKFVDLSIQYKNIKSEIQYSIDSVIAQNAFINGPFAKQFEDAFSKSLKVKHCIGVGNGTDAIFLALKAMGIGPGDVVFTAANSFIATSEAISATGAKVAFIDCCEKDYTIDTYSLEQKIKSWDHTKGRPAAIVPVHLYGRAARMDDILRIAKEYNLRILEDSAQAHLAQYHGKFLGSIGDCGTFSFYPGKNLGAYGDAGCVTTNDDALAKKIRMLANHGRVSKYDHEFEGFNSRLDGIQGAILTAKLKHLEKWTAARIQIAQWYKELLKDISQIVLPEILDNYEHVYHLFVIQLKTFDRTKLQDALKESGIETIVHYPIALPNLQAYKYLGHSELDFPASTSLAKKILSLPIYPELQRSQVEYICNEIKRALI